MSEPLRALIVEDSQDDARLVLRELRRAGYETVFERVESADAMRAALAARTWDLILCDYVVPGFGGLEALEIAKESGLDLPFILLSNKVSEETLVEAMRAGATDFLMKDRLERLGPVVKRELVDAAARRGLRLAQIQWRTAFDAVQDALFIHDAEGRIVRANLAYTALGGLPTKEIIGKLYWEVFPKTDGPLASCATEIKTLNWTQEEFGLPAGATYVSRSYPVLDAKGAYLYSLHVLQDISVRHVEERRQRFEAKRLAVTLALSGMLGANEQAVLDFVLEQCRTLTESRYSFIGWVNEDESAMTIHAWSKDAMAQCAMENMPQVFPLAEAGLWAEPIRQRRTVIINDCAPPQEHKHGLPPGHVPISRYLGVPVFENERIVLFAAVANKESEYTQSDADNLTSVMIDASRVIQRRRTEEDRRASEERHRLLFESSRDALMTLAPPSWKFTGANQATLQLFGASSVGEFTELSSWNASPETQPDGRRSDEKAQEMIATAMREGKNFFEWQHCRLDGSPFAADVLLTRMEVAGEVFLQATVRDITERKRDEQNRLLEAKRLEVSLTLSKMIDQSEQAILDFVLEQCIGICESRYSLIGRIDANESAMTVHAFSNDAMAQCAVQSTPPVFALAGAGLWAEPIRQRHSVFINDCTAPHAHRHGAPAGHVEVKRYLGVPVFERDRIVMLIAVANKESDYTQSDAQRLSSLATDAWRVIERQRAEHALVRSNRALRTLSEGNEALVRATDETELLDTVCQLMVQQGGYRMAWVGYADDNAARSITPRAWAGTEKVELDSLKLSWADTERGQSPMSRAIRTGEPQLTRDILSDPGFELWCQQASAHGFVSVFACPLRVDNRIIGALAIYAAEADVFVAEELDLLKELVSDLAYGIETLRTRCERQRLADAQVRDAERLQRSLEQSIQTIADTVEARDPYTAGHQRRVGELAVAIAQELGLPRETIHGIRLAAGVHDLGKIRVPAEILAKSGKLNVIEFMLMKAHPQTGYDILKEVDFPWPIADIVRQHHERMDGSGYPQGIKGDDILLESRILAVADVVEAIASHRPYRPALGIDAALKEIEAGRGTAFDAAVVDACIRLFSEKRFAFSG